MKHFNLEFDYGGLVLHHTFYILSDTHFGGLIDEDQLDRDIEAIAQDPTACWIHLGDVIDAIQMKDKRFDPTCIADWVSLKDPVGSQVDYAVHKLARIKDKCRGMAKGNHEDTVEQKWERAVHDDLCKQLGVPSLGFSATLNLIFRRGEGKNRGGTRIYPVYLHHGTGGGGSNEERSLRAPLEIFDTYPNVRISLMGHTHDRNAILVNRIYVDLKGPVARTCLAARTGSYLVTNTEETTTYAEKRGYRPLAPGCLRFYIAPYKDLISLDLANVI